MAKRIKHFWDEADIGSGEKTTGQHEVEQEVQTINAHHASHPQDGRQLHDVVEEQEYAEQRSALDGSNRTEADRRTELERPSGEQLDQPFGPTATDSGSRVVQSGAHIARITIARQPDGRYEAKVYVRLTREPEAAETYVPAGVFESEAEAWMAAEERAKRALNEHEF